MKPIIYDAKNQILGRLATKIARKLLEGERVFVVNAEKAVISGDPRYTIELYKKRRARGDPKKGPFFPRTPDGMFRRAVRGMLPWHKHRGREAFRRLRVYVGMPEELKGKGLLKVKEADVTKLRTKYITLGRLALELGAKKRR
jgi:large subunit ribosomal protein L13